MNDVRDTFWGYVRYFAQEATIFEEEEHDVRYAEFTSQKMGASDSTWMNEELRNTVIESVRDRRIIIDNGNVHNYGYRFAFVNRIDGERHPNERRRRFFDIMINEGMAFARQLAGLNFPLNIPRTQMRSHRRVTCVGNIQFFVIAQAHAVWYSHGFNDDAHFRDELAHLWDSCNPLLTNDAALFRELGGSNVGRNVALAAYNLRDGGQDRAVQAMRNIANGRATTRIAFRVRLTDVLRDAEPVHSRLAYCFRLGLPADANQLIADYFGDPVNIRRQVGLANAIRREIPRGHNHFVLDNALNALD